MKDTRPFLLEEKSMEEKQSQNTHTTKTSGSKRTKYWLTPGTVGSSGWWTRWDCGSGILAGNLEGEVTGSQSLDCSEVFRKFLLLFFFSVGIVKPTVDFGRELASTYFL